MSGGGKLYNAEACVQAAEQIGADAVLLKPFGADDLDGTVVWYGCTVNPAARMVAMMHQNERRAKSGDVACTATAAPGGAASMAEELRAKVKPAAPPAR